MEAGGHTHPENVTALVDRLVDALRGRRFPAEAIGANMVWVADRGADSERVDSGLRPMVICRARGDGGLGWWWVLSGAGGGPEYEWICPALEVTRAADAVTRILTLRSSDGRVGE